MKARAFLHSGVVCVLLGPALVLGSCSSKDGGESGTSPAEGGSPASNGNGDGDGDVTSGDGDGDNTSTGGAPVGVPNYVPCPELDTAYSGEACTGGCAAVSCDCPMDFPLSLVVCHETLGCLTALDCDVACEQKLSRIVKCAQGEGECLEDDECAGFCVGESSTEVGTCSPGALGDACVLGDDCAGNSCNDEVCTGDAEIRSACSQGFECASLHCFDGECVSGEVGQECTEDEHCQGFCAVRLCSEGENGQSCAGPDDCEDGVCARGEFAHPVCSAGGFGESCNEDDDCDSKFCRSAAANCGGGSGYVCMAGNSGDACCNDDNCQSGMCVRSSAAVSPVTRECSSGKMGQLCDDGRDDSCTEGYCVRDACEQTAPSKCLDGGDGTRCCYDADCDSGNCKRVDAFDSKTWVCVAN